MLNELESVVLTHDLAAYSVQPGDMGAVVHVYAAGDGHTMALLTLTEADIRVMGEREILHARPLA